MQIFHKKDEFLFTIFPELQNAEDNEIIEKLKEYYTYGPFKPSVTIDADLVKVEIDTPTIVSLEADYRKAVKLAESKKYSEALTVLEDLISKNPTNSEFHRIKGQILSELGDQEESINSLIDSLRWDSKNGWALLMMGNIFARYKNDIQTALKYYNQALIANPKDNITLNNIGANLMQLRRFEEAKEYFWKAIEIDRSYPNTHFALGMIAEKEGDLHSAFYSTIESLKLNKSKDGLFRQSLQQAIEIANSLMQLNEGQKIINEYLHKLEFEGGVEIEQVEDSNIPTAAKIEFAENHKRNKHVIRVKPNYPAHEHLVMHELVHLYFVIEAKKAKNNLLYITNQQNKELFIKSLATTIKKYQKLGFSEDSIERTCSGLFEGINQQIYNAPIDLFIEEFLFNEFPNLRPYQFISLFNLVKEGLEAVTNKQIVNLSPPEILSKSKIYNLVTALQFKSLFGINLINEYKATPSELKQAQTFFDEFQDYKHDKEPGEEYELVQNWANDLKLNKNFELIDETVFRNKRVDFSSLLDSIEKDPYDLEAEVPHKKREMDKFQKSQAELGTNMAVVMYMVDALQFFKGMSKDKIKNIAFEIAMQGIHGFHPENENYKLNNIPGKKFTGYHILAYYYVSWALAIPEMLNDLNLPYDNEYEIALTMAKQS